MRLTSGSHWFGVVFIFVAALLLVIASITAPVVKDLNLFNVVILPGFHDEQITIRFGTFGWCTSNKTMTDCSHIGVGYPICGGMYSAIRETPNDSNCDAADSATHAMVLHPVASATAFIAAFVAMAAGFAGSLAGGVIAALAWIFALVCVGVDFTVFGMVKKRLDDFSEQLDIPIDIIEGNFGPVIWCVVAAFVLLTVGTPIILYTCFKVRREERRTAGPVRYRHESAMSGTTADDKDNVYRS